jgi:zinc transporter ZupT
VAAGTFIHISAIEIIPSAFKDSHTPEVLQLGSLTTGFLSMSLLRRWV